MSNTTVVLDMLSQTKQLLELHAQDLGVIVQHLETTKVEQGLDGSAQRYLEHCVALLNVTKQEISAIDGFLGGVVSANLDVECANEIVSRMDKFSKTDLN